MKILDRKDGEVVASYSEDEFEFIMDMVKIFKRFCLWTKDMEIILLIYSRFLLALNEFIKEWEQKDIELLK